MEKILPSSPEYKLIKQEFDIVINNITRKDNFDKFIGGLPITLEKKDLFTILSKNLNDNYRYTVTQKVDGNRLLLFANFKKSNGLRNITFIDRNNDFYTLKNTSRDDLPDFEGPRVLIDGELVIFGTDGKVVNIDKKYFNIKKFLFMAFDILYGPINIEYSGVPNDKRLNIGSEGAMAGPIGGKMWPYQKRYDILHQLIVPNELNDFRPILSLAFKNCLWFTPEIKPIYFINPFFNMLYNGDKKLYVQKNSTSFFYKKLNEFRKNFYKLLEDNKIKKIGEIPKVSLDGLIFTPFDTQYVIGGPWKEFLNIQYKWKPVEEQSIDFAIFIDKDEYFLKIIKGTNLETYKYGKYPAKISEKTKELLNEEPLKNEILNKKIIIIGEFTFNTQTNEFQLLRIRKDKDTPNSLTTAINVMNAIKNPVNLEILKKFFVADKLTNSNFKDLLQYMTKSQLLRCAVKNNELDIFNTENKNNILEQFENFKINKDYEFEIRFGIIHDKFEPNLSFNIYKQFGDIISSIYKDVKFEYSVFYDMYSEDNVRTRYLYLENLNNIFKLETIKKEKIKYIDINLQYLFNIDLRFSLSSEKKINRDVTEENANIILEKKRYSIKFDIFRFDMTEIIKKDNSNNNKPKFQFEIEIVKKNVPNNILIDKIKNQLTKIMSLMDL